MFGKTLVLLGVKYAGSEERMAIQLSFSAYTPKRKSDMILVRFYSNPVQSKNAYKQPKVLKNDVGEGSRKL